MENKEVKIIKKSIDMPVDLFEAIMKYAHEQKIYKFGPAILKLLRESLEEK